ncbi:MAG TPA: hypothetical protein PLD75_04765 [Spirochaetota bacterium]|nr:hypothetical protein [Spirochaetota bacterium]
MNEEVEKRWLEIKLKILNDLGNRNNIKVYIPRWKPVDLKTGLEWIQKTIYEGYYVKYRIRDNDHLELMYWEFGEDEPDFS